MTRTLALAAALLAVLAVPAAAVVGTAKTIVVVTHGSMRAVVAAHKTSGGQAPTAAITVTVYRVDRHAWHRTRNHRLTSTFFWRTVTAPHALCRLELAGTRLSISVLISPSIGCSKTSTVEV